MKRFKKYRPVNLTSTPSKDTEKMINKWNNGEIKLMIGHPACLHPDTEVLTKRAGWVKIVDVKNDDLVFDGIEFVSHDGCSYSGYKEVIDVFGITMTPGHKLLIDNEWVEARHVDTTKQAKRKAVFGWEVANNGGSGMYELWKNPDYVSSELCKTQSQEEHPLFVVHKGNVSQHDTYQNMANMVRFTTPGKRSFRQELWWSWDNCMRRMAEQFREVLRGHVGYLFRRSDNRTHGCEQTILQSELPMGYQHGTAVQQEDQPLCDILRGKNPFSRISEKVRVQPGNAEFSSEQRDDSGRSGSKLSNITVREKHETERCETKRIKKEHVYDLVNCGPRHRFIIKNKDGEVFVSHNSMGHGVDGLQESGSILVWFGLNWSLELYEQMCGRLNRQGQSRPVSIIRILCRDTIDLAVADAIERKTDDQDGLKKALQRYRDGITDNDLSVNFF